MRTIEGTIPIRIGSVCNTECKLAYGINTPFAYERVIRSVSQYDLRPELVDTRQVLTPLSRHFGVKLQLTMCRNISVVVSIPFEMVRRVDKASHDMLIVSDFQLFATVTGGYATARFARALEVSVEKSSTEPENSSPEWRL